LKKIKSFSIPQSEYLRIKVLPKSPKSEIVDIMDDKENGQTIKIRIKAAPEKGRANAELIGFLSKEMKVSKNNITIIAGKTEQLKLIKIKY
jgi:uncharacterized protein